MAGVTFAPLTQTTQGSAPTEHDDVLSTTAGVTLWSSGSETYYCPPADFHPLPELPYSRVLLRIVMTKNGAPLQTAGPPGTASQYERATVTGVTGSFTTTGDNSGTTIYHSLVVDPINPDNETTLIMTNTQDVAVEDGRPAMAGYFFDITITGSIDLVSRWYDTPPAYTPPGVTPPSPTAPTATVPTPVPVPPPTSPPQQVTVQANDVQPAVTVGWRHDDRWPELIQINQLGLAIAIQHPRLTGASGRTQLHTGTKWVFRATDNPLGEHVEVTYTLQRIPDTKADGSNLFLTFDDPGAGFNAGLLV